jgi:hypothetical protein
MPRKAKELSPLEVRRTRPNSRRSSSPTTAMSWCCTPTSQPACAPERESRVETRRTPESTDADLHRWRETFAERLREWGIDAEATRHSRPRRRSQLPGTMAQEGSGGGQSARSATGAQGQAWGASPRLACIADPKDQRQLIDQGYDMLLRACNSKQRALTNVSFACYLEE